MGEFLKVLPYQNARQLIIDNFPQIETEYLSLSAASQHILAHDVFSPEDMPAFHRSTVDGYALQAEDSFGSSETLPGFVDYVGAVQMGESTNIELSRGQCCWIPTGGMLPQGSNAVVMVEYTEKLDEGTILISKPVAPWENVMQKGEDIARDSRLFAAGHLLRPQDIGMLASLGISSVQVAKLCRIGIVSTGDEIVPPDAVLSPGQIRDVNSYSLAAAIETCGCLPCTYPIVRDDKSALKDAMARALDENDLVLLSGGSSVGVADYSLEVLLSFPEASLLFHGIAVKPGKPTMGVKVGPKLVVGLPGHPVAALMMFNILCRPAISGPVSPPLPAKLLINTASQAGRDDFIPVQLTEEEGQLLAQPLLGKSGLMSILARADGYINIAYEQQGLIAGEVVRVTLF